MQPFRPTVMAIYEDIHLKQLAEELSERENKPIGPDLSTGLWVREEHFPGDPSQRGPLWPQTCSACAHVAQVLCPLHSLSAHICQVDEHTIDLLVVAPDGTGLTRHGHGAVLICVKTAAIL